MKKNILLIITVILTGITIMCILDKRQVSVFTAEAFEKKQAGVIKVQGTAEVMAEPDIAFINFGVETTQTELTAAQNENSAIMSSVIKALKDLGISPDNIQTNNFSINPSYDYSGGISKKNGYQVHNTIRVKLKDLEKTGKVIDAVTAAGANLFYGIEFSLADKSEYYLNALQKALSAAKEKAQLIAGSQGVKLGLLVSVIEHGYQDSSLFMRKENAMSFADVASVSTPISSGKLSIVAAVEVSYSIS